MAVASEIVVRGDGTEWARLASFAEAFAAREGIGEADRARLLIVLEELLTNLSKYGYPTGEAKAGGHATVALRHDGGWLCIDFEDDGAAFDPLSHAAPDLDAAPEARPVGGLGLQVVRSLMPRSRYRRVAGRNCLHLAFSLEPQEDR